MMRIHRLLPLLALAAAACGDAPDPAEKRPLGAPAAQGPRGGEAGALPAPVQMHVDSGNAAYRAKEYERALAHYREAARAGPDQAVAWFGVGMAASALGDEALADSARERVRSLSPGTAADPHHPGNEPPGAAEQPAGTR